MAYYAYKQVRDLLPQHIIDAQGPDYEGDANYDGDQWDAAADYIEELKAQNAQLLEFVREWLVRQGTDENYMVAKARAAIAAAEKER